MDFLSLISSHEVAGFFITLAGQSILISITGLILIKLLYKKSAPLRSLVSVATIIAMGLLIVIFIGARLSDISWQNEPVPVIEHVKISNAIAISDQYELASVIDKEKISSVISVPNQYEPLPIEPVPQTIAPSDTPDNIDKAYPTLENSPYSISLSSAVITLINILGLIWIIGVLFQLFRLGYGLIVVKKFKRSLQAIKDASFNNMLSNIAVALFRKWRLVPRLYRSSLIESPMAIGFIHPAIIIPEKLFTTLTDNELKSILLHEMAHIYHYDQVTGIIKRFVIAFHWWNPFVYIINKEHEQAREEVSDNYVLNELSPGDYSRCLMNLAEKVSLISNIPFASGMAGRGFNLIKRVEQILSKQRSNAMNTRLSFKTIVFVCLAVLTFSIAGIHARVSAVKSDDTVKVLQEPLPVINPVPIIKEVQNLTQKNIPVPEAVDEPDKLQSIPNIEAAPQKELPDKQMQENKEQVMVMASVEMNAMNEIIKPLDLVDVQSSDETALIKEQAENLVLTQNETAEDPNLHSATVPDNAVQNVTQNDAATDPKKVDIDTAIAELNRQIELNGSDAGLYMLRGNLHMDKQDYELAINDFTKAIKINPDEVTAYNNRGLAYANMGEHKKAIKEYKKAIKIDPENIYAYINRGNAYLQEKKFSNAIKDFSKAIELDNRDAATYLLRGDTYRWKGEHGQAINDYSRALEINPALINAYKNRGMAYEEMGELDKAILEYSKAIVIISENPEAFINMKISMKKEQILIDFGPYYKPYNYKRDGLPSNYKDERKSYSQISYYYDRVAYRLLPVDFLPNIMVIEPLYSYINRGLAYEKKDQLDKAIADFSRFIEIIPNQAFAYHCRSKVYRKMGNEVEYINDLNMAEKYGYKSRLADSEILGRETLGRKGYWEGSPDNPNYYNYNNLPPDFYNISRAR